MRPSAPGHSGDMSLLALDVGENRRKNGVSKLRIRDMDTGGQESRAKKDSF